MMQELSPELIALLYFLLPGFVALWVFHGLTAHKRADAFERVISALIFTALVQGILPPLKDLLLFLGDGLPEAYRIKWHDEYKLGYSILLSFLIGIVAAGLANNDFIHRFLRNRHLWMLRHENHEEWKWSDWRWTKRTSFPSQWWAAFSQLESWVVLHLSDEQNRRLMGYAWEWPDHPTEGHFAMRHLRWLTDESDDNQPESSSQAFLVPVSNVLMVEFLGGQEDQVPPKKGIFSFLLPRKKDDEVVMLPVTGIGSPRQDKGLPKKNRKGGRH